MSWDLFRAPYGQWVLLDMQAITYIMGSHAVGRIVQHSKRTAGWKTSAHQYQYNQGKDSSLPQWRSMKSRLGTLSIRLSAKLVFASPPGQRSYPMTWQPFLLWQNEPSPSANNPATSIHPSANPRSISTPRHCHGDGPKCCRPAPTSHFLRIRLQRGHLAQGHTKSQTTRRRQRP